MAKKNTFTSNLGLAQLGVMSALIIIMTFVPYLGYISYGWLSITLIHIPVIIGACVCGPGGGAALGAVWGVTCIIKAVLAPPTPLEGIIFRNPLVALIPRVLAGLAAGTVYYLFRSKPKLSSLACALSALVCCLINTALVMGAIYVFFGDKYGAELGIGTVSFGGLTKYVLAAFGINSVLETAAGILICIPIVKALKKVHLR